MLCGDRFHGLGALRPVHIVVRNGAQTTLIDGVHQDAALAQPGADIGGRQAGAATSKTTMLVSTLAGST